MSLPKVEQSVREANAAVRMSLPFDNTEDFDDARACTACSCGVRDCGGEVFVYDDPTCSSCAGLCSGLEEGDCEAFPLGANLHLAYVAEGTCQIVPSVPSGAVTPADPWTVCCLP